jgi:hypothetical protein
MRINVEARLLALKASCLILTAIALLAIFPCHGLPNYILGEVPSCEVTETKVARSAGKKKVIAPA